MRCDGCSTQLPESTTECPVCGRAVASTLVGRTGGDGELPATIRGSGQLVGGGASSARPLASKWRRAMLAVASIAVLMVASLGAWGYATSQDLSAARADLELTRIERETIRTDLTSTTSKLTSMTSDLAAVRLNLTQEQAARSAAVAQVAQLQKQVAVQAACIQSLNVDVAELQRISVLMTNNYNLRAAGSTWANANSARNVAVTNALDDYYQGYSSAYNGLKSTANSWIDLGNTQVAIASQQVAIMNAEVSRMNSGNDQIGSALGAFAVRLSDTNSTCGF